MAAPSELLSELGEMVLSIVGMNRYIAKSINGL
jgi:hypothetical protein